MSKFNIGDKVVIRNIKVGEEYNKGCRVRAEMVSYVGRTAIITHIDASPELRTRYTLDIDGRWAWSDDMLDHAEYKLWHTVHDKKSLEIITASLKGACVAKNLEKDRIENEIIHLHDVLSKVNSEIEEIESLQNILNKQLEQICEDK